MGADDEDRLVGPFGEEARAGERGGLCVVVDERPNRDAIWQGRWAISPVITARAFDRTLGELVRAETFWTQPALT